MFKEITKEFDKLCDSLRKIKWLSHVPGFRSGSASHMLIAFAYYIITFFISAVSGSFLLPAVMFWSAPFIVTSIIDACRYKKYKGMISIPICLAATIIAAAMTGSSVKPIEIHIAENEIIFDDINQSHEIAYTVVPGNADKANIELVSENEAVANFENNSLLSKSEGETTVYAKLKNSDVTSEKIHVVVHDKAAEAEREEQARAAQAEREAQEKAAEEARQKAEQEAQAQKEAEAAQKEAEKAQAQKEAEESAKQEAESSAEQNSAQDSDADSASADTVYVGKTGNKYHRKSCSTLKGKGRAISLEDAKAEGRQPCKRCY